MSIIQDVVSIITRNADSSRSVLKDEHKDNLKSLLKRLRDTRLKKYPYFPHIARSTYFSRSFHDYKLQCTSFLTFEITTKQHISSSSFKFPDAFFSERARISLYII